jgi:hypothetical protein
MVFMNPSEANEVLRVLSGKRVEQLRFDYAVTLVFDDDADMRISAPFAAISPAPVAVDPEALTAETLALTISVLHKTVVSASIVENSVLRLELEGDLVLHAQPSERYEAWSLNLPNGTQLESYPGGEIA